VVLQVLQVCILFICKIFPTLILIYSIVIIKLQCPIITVAIKLLHIITIKPLHLVTIVFKPKHHSMAIVRKPYPVTMISLVPLPLFINIFPTIIGKCESYHIRKPALRSSQLAKRYIRHLIGLNKSIDIEII